MIGYDRPLKPEWIYQTLTTIVPGSKPSDFYDSYINLAVERIGKDGRRKTRTVLFRTFIFSFQENTSVIENNFLMDLCRKNDMEYLKPILLSKFIIDYEMLNFLTKKLNQIFDSTQEIASTALTKKMVEEFGDLEIVKRSTRAFLKTLTYFKLLFPINITRFKQVPKTSLSNEQIRDILLLLAIVNKTKQIDLKHLDTTIFSFYQKPDLHKIASEFNSKNWDYIRGVNRELLMIK
jgi:hypothetical protein